MKHRALAAAALWVCATLLAGCGVSLPGTTGSLFGAEQPAAPVAVNNPTTRAIQVGRTAARAQKCGFNFDPTKLRTQFLMAESAAMPDAAGVDKIGQTYDTSYRAVLNAIGQDAEAYCTDARTRGVKLALNRHLAGDYTPDPPEPVEQEDGLFSGWGGGSGSSSGLDIKPSTAHDF
jgi:hypothetical protein